VIPCPSRTISINSITGAEKLGARCACGSFAPRNAETIRLGEFDGAGERISGQFAGFRIGLAERKARGIDVAEIDQRHHAVLPYGARRRSDALDVELHAGMRHAHLEHARVPDHHQPRHLGEIAVGQDPCGLLRPDPGAIAGNEADDGEFFVTCAHVQLALV
jgi:hypothetical protein